MKSPASTWHYWPERAFLDSSLAPHTVPVVIKMADFLHIGNKPVFYFYVIVIPALTSLCCNTVLKKIFEKEQVIDRKRCPARPIFGC